jgi:hypothetical protein
MQSKPPQLITSLDQGQAFYSSKIHRQQLFNLLFSMHYFWKLTGRLQFFSIFYEDLITSTGLLRRGERARVFL